MKTRDNFVLTKDFKRSQVDKTFGKWLRRQLFQINKSNAWLYRRCKLAGGSINRWTVGQEPSIGPFMRILQILAAERQIKVTEVFDEYQRYIYD
tara:strand:- start:642 stop:923 length:282 start_codon:yes stop_codon:yes gene_type:complete